MVEEKQNQASQKMTKRTGCAMILFAALVLTFIISHFFQPNRDEETKSQPNRVSLKVDIRVDGELLVIKNINKYTWNLSSLWGDRIRININDNFMYLYPYPIKAGEEVKILLRLFTNDEGLRFNPDFFKVKAISITCKEDFDAWEFR